MWFGQMSVMIPTRVNDVQIFVDRTGQSERNLHNREIWVSVLREPTYSLQTRVSTPCSSHNEYNCSSEMLQPSIWMLRMGKGSTS